MLVRLVGVHKVRAKLASGERVDYLYAWRGGPRIRAAEGSPEFLAEYTRLTRSRPKGPGVGTLAELIRAYVASEAYKARKASTRKGYDWAIDKIEAEFHDVPYAAFALKGFRNDVVTWRDEEFGETPRAGDMVIAVFRMILAFGLDREIIDKNPLEGVGKLSNATRRDTIWTDEQIAAFKATAPARLVLALELARWTGQRQGDLLRLTWSAYDGHYLTLKQGKTGAAVRVKVAQELKALLDAQKRTAVTIITNRSGLPYTEAFKSSWRKAVARAGIKGVTFHDLRGTFITNAYRAGASIKEIAEVSGHEEKDAERIIRKHYLRTDGAVTKLELGNKQRTNT
jgi:integrase